MASYASHDRAARPVPPYTTRSSGRSATSGSRLFISIRIAASCGHDRHDSSVPRGARISRAVIVHLRRRSRCGASIVRRAGDAAERLRGSQPWPRRVIEPPHRYRYGPRRGFRRNFPRRRGRSRVADPHPDRRRRACPAGGARRSARPRGEPGTGGRGRRRGPGHRARRCQPSGRRARRREHAGRRRPARGARDHPGLPHHARDRAVRVRGSPHRARDAPCGRRRLPRQGHRRTGPPGFDRQGGRRRREPVRRADRRHRARALVAAAPRGDRIPASSRRSEARSTGSSPGAA